MKYRDINITKYRKLLQQLQSYCSDAKDKLTFQGRTDHQRGHVDGRHAAYNDVLRKLDEMIEYAETDWEHVYCREEESNNDV